MSVHAQLIILCEYYTLWPVMHSKMATGPWSSQPINLSMSERMQIKSGETFKLSKKYAIGYGRYTRLFN